MIFEIIENDKLPPDGFLLVGSRDVVVCQGGRVNKEVLHSLKPAHKSYELGEVVHYRVSGMAAIGQVVEHRTEFHPSFLDAYKIFDQERRVIEWVSAKDIVGR